MTMYFKAIEPKYVHALRDDGSVRVGTLQDFRNSTDTVRRDEKEGVRDITLRPTERIELSSEAMSRWMPDNVSIGGGFVRLESDSKATFGVTLPDAYTFSVSEADDQRLLKKFGSGSYEIANLHTFGKMIFEALQLIDGSVYAWHAARVVYGDEKNPEILSLDDLVTHKTFELNDVRFRDYFVKPLAFATEREVRFLFLTQTERIKPRILKCDTVTVRKCCRF